MVPFRVQVWGANQEEYSREEVDHREIVRMLLNHPNININVQTNKAQIYSWKAEGWTALMLAAKTRASTKSGSQERVEMVELLLAKPGINLEVQNSKGETALILAAAHKNVRITQALIRAGANREYAEQFAARDNNGQTILETLRDSQALSAMPVAAVQVERVAQPAPGAQETPVFQNFENCIKSFLAMPEFVEGVDPNIILAPLLLAAHLGNLPLVKRLLERHADSDIRDHNGNTPLHLAIMQEHTLIALHLIESGCNVNPLNKLGKTPLMLATQYGNMSVVDSLLAKGADPLVQDAEGKTYHDYLFKSERNQIQMNGPQV